MQGFGDACSIFIFMGFLFAEAKKLPSEDMIRVNQDERPDISTVWNLAGKYLIECILGFDFKSFPAL